MRRRICIALTLGVLVSASAATGDVQTEKTLCLSDSLGHCEVRPHTISTGAVSNVTGIHWRDWNDSNVVGYGRFFASGGCCEPDFGPARTKVRLGNPVECRRRQWYTHVIVAFGPHFRRHFINTTEWRAGPCE